jgi:hypothetical protein
MTKLQYRYMQTRGTPGWLFVLIVIFLGGVAMWVNDVTSPTLEDYQKTLTAEGYTDVQLTGYQYLGCAQDDYYREGFVGVKNNHTVTGVVCGGTFKGSVVRVLTVE